MILAALAFAGLAPAYASEAVTEQVETFGPVAVGQPMPTFAGYDDQDRFVRSKELLTASPNGLIVSFFATWCGPCKAGMPVIDKAVAAREGWGATFVDLGEEPAKVQKFLDDIGGVSGTLIFDRNGMIAKRYGVGDSLPKTFVIGADGNVRTIFVTEGGDFSEKLDAVLAAAAEAPAQASPEVEPTP